MSQTLTTKIRGLYTHPSEISEVPEGALSRAKNINIDEESVATPRRGFDRMGYAFASASDRANRLHEYQDKLIAHYATNSLAYDSGSAWVAYSGTYDPPDSSTPVRFADANENLYFTTDKGIKKLDIYTGTPVNSGVQKAISLQGAVTSGATFAQYSTLSYRSVWGYEDENNNLILGAPSERVVVFNDNAATRDVSLTVSIPSEVTASYILQVYRSPVAIGTSGNEASPSDELQLCYEVSPSAGEITAKELTFTDSLDETLLGATLYTSPSQETILGANNRPPLAKDLAQFKEHLFFANTKTLHRKQITLLGVSSTGLQVDDVVTIGAEAYTAKTSSPSANQFLITTSGSVSQNIRDSSLDLVRSINEDSSSYYAYYISGVSDTPGKILIEARDLSVAQFAVIFNPATGTNNPWQPVLPTSGSTVVSSNDEFKNGISFSKYQQPEAVPLLQQFRVGSADAEILRILPLRDSLFVLKEDGVWRITGEDASSFRVDQFDNTAKIIGSKTAVSLNNAIYFLSDQGVVMATETGISVISRAIENTFLETFGIGLSNVKSYSYAVGYESERKYILGTISSSSDTEATKFYVYNTFTQAWTTWENLNTKFAYVNPVDDKLYLAHADSNYVLKERKSYSNVDQADFGSAETISDVTSLTLTMSGTDTISAGDIIYQSATAFSVVSAVDSVAGTVTVEYDGSLTAAACTVYRAISTEIEWVPIHGGNPSISKHFREVSLLFKRNFINEATIGFYSEVSQSVEDVTLTGSSFGLWGFFVWGSIPWGGQAGREPERTYVPLEKQRCTQLSVRFSASTGFSDYKLNGMAAHFREIGERFGT